MKRKTQIIATLGPASSTEVVFSKMIPFTDGIRLNFSWGTHEEMEKLIVMVRKVSEREGKRITIIQDLSGPREQTNAGHHFKNGVENVLTEKDIKDLDFGIKHDVDYVALSYVGNAGDITLLREYMEKKNVHISIIAKIERREAIDNIKEIIDVCDRIMIARGDLGEVFPIEEIPFLERRILSLCKKKSRFAIVATEMLLSMVKESRPTRAEVTDVAYAVSGGADAVMLSEETATGINPPKVVEVMAKIVSFAEEHRLL